MYDHMSVWSDKDHKYLLLLFFVHEKLHINKQSENFKNE